MNPRLQELAEQSTKKLHGFSYRFGHTTETIFDHEKFAELIVRECAMIADTDRSNLLGCGYITKTNGMRIKEHFEVEE